jgi:hypothetical protein
MEYRMTIMSKLANSIFTFAILIVMLGMPTSIIGAFIKEFHGIKDVQLFLIIYSIFGILSGVAFTFCMKSLNQYKVILEEENLIICGLFRKEIMNLKSFNYCIRFNIYNLPSIIKLEPKNKNIKTKYIIGNFDKEEELINRIISQLNRNK